jgi:hypothetical protein
VAKVEFSAGDSDGDDRDWPEGDRLSPELEEKIAQQMRDGISLSIRWRLMPPHPRWGEVAAIHWHPGDPNELARVICKRVRATPMPLDLDGKKFLIQRVEEWPEGWDQDT